MIKTTSTLGLATRWHTSLHLLLLYILLQAERLQDRVHNFRHPEECEQGNKMDCRCWRCHYREFSVSETHRRNVWLKFKMETHIVNMKRACYIQLRGLHKIRRYLTSEAAEKLTHAFVTSRLDSLNSLLVRMPAYQIAKLQLIQNHAARIVTEQRRSCHITPILKDLHWLPVAAHIDFKLHLHVYKCLYGTARTISLPNFRSILAPSPTWPWDRQWTLSNCISLCFTWRNLATEPFQWLDVPSGMNCRGVSDTVLVSPDSSRHWRPISTIDHSFLYLPNFLTLFFPGLPGQHRANGWLRLLLLLY